MIKTSALLALFSIVDQCQGITINTEHQQSQGGIFSSMIEQATAPERNAAEKEEARKRKQQQLDEAEKVYQ